MLKNLPEKSLKKVRKPFLYGKKLVLYAAGLDRRTQNTATGSNAAETAKKTDDNLDDRIATFACQIKNKFTYRIPLRYLCDIGKINFPTKIDMKLRLMPETNMKRLFETKKNLVTRNAAGNADLNGTPGIPNAQIVLLKGPYIQYEQLTLSKNFQQYLETILFSSKVLRMVVQKTPCQKTYELQTLQLTL